MFRKALNSFEQAPRLPGTTLSPQLRAKRALRWTLVTCPLPQFHDPPRAIAYSKSFLQEDTESADNWNALGIAYYRAGEWDEAIDSLNRAIGLRDVDDSSDHYFLAMAHW